MKQHWSNRLEKMNACQEAVEYARTKKTYAEAWRDCERADWMLWLVGKLAGDKPESAARRKLCGAAADCAATALKYVPKGERRPALCIREVRRWARSDPRVTLETLSAAEAAAWDAAAGENAWDAAWAAAEAAAWAAAAWSAAGDADWAAAEAAAWAAADWDAAWAAAAWAAALKRMAKMVRRHYPMPPRFKNANR